MSYVLVLKRCMCFNHGMHVSVTEVLDLLQGLANDKATGMEGLSGESLKFADPILAILSSILFYLYVQRLLSSS